MGEKFKKGVVFALAIMTAFAFTPFLFSTPDPEPQQRGARSQQQAEVSPDMPLVATSSESNN